MSSMKLVHEVETGCPLLQLARTNHLIFAFDGQQHLLEIDIKHHLLIKNKLEHPPLCVKSLLWQNRMQYFSITADRLQLLGTQGSTSSQSTTVSQSNSKAEFTGLVDSLEEGLLFSKYHRNYRKHSINYYWQGSKRILKLSDAPFSRLIFNPCTSQVIYSIRETVNCFDLERPEKEISLLKKSTFLQDRAFLYYLTLNLENKSREEYECGIFDFRNGKNTNTWIAKEIPIKCETFGNVLVVASKHALEIFDIRKLIKPFVRDPLSDCSDFLYEPNLSKIFVACHNKLKVFQTEF